MHDRTGLAAALPCLDVQQPASLVQLLYQCLLAGWLTGL